MVVAATGIGYGCGKVELQRLASETGLRVTGV